MSTSSKIALPPRSDGAPAPVLAPHVRRLIIIGANGAGKSRFGAWLRRQLNTDASAVSALRALYTVGAAGDSLIDRRYRKMTSRSMIRADLDTEFARMLAVLLDEEASALFAGRFGGDAGSQQPRLEKLVELWEQIFPDNRVLVESGRLLISPRSGDDSYESARLSDGEKAVIYYLGCTLLTPPRSPMIVDNPGLFLNRAVMGRVWDMDEAIHPGPIVYVTHNLDFASTRSSMPGTITVWVKSYDAAHHTWDYELLPEGSEISEDVFLALLGARKPVLFIEGDSVRSIDAKLYPLVFPDYSVKSLGSCNKVIEATRTFNSLGALHSLAATGIVDRDRRTDREVEYLRSHSVLVPEVAEIENILMLEDVIRAVASYHGRDPHKAFTKVKRTLLKLFSAELNQQALLHTRHYVKRTTEYSVDRRFDNIGQLEAHVGSLVDQLAPRKYYNNLVSLFRDYVAKADYNSVLRVYNRKSMVSETNVGSLTGGPGSDLRSYSNDTIAILRAGGREAGEIARAIRRCFGVDTTNVK